MSLRSSGPKIVLNWQTGSEIYTTSIKWTMMMNSHTARKATLLPKWALLPTKAPCIGIFPGLLLPTSERTNKKFSLSCKLQTSSPIQRVKISFFIPLPIKIPNRLSESILRLIRSTSPMSKSIRRGKCS